MQLHINFHLYLGGLIKNFTSLNYQHLYMTIHIELIETIIQMLHITFIS
jgi:hypothetical protein